MGSNIVLVCGGYHPNFSATGNCIRQIAKQFVAQGANVYVICKSSDGLESTDGFEGQKLYRITDKRVRDFVTVRETDKSSVGGKIKVFAIKSFWATRLLLSKSGMDEALVDSYEKKLDELSSIGIDAVLPCCMPMEAVKASYRFCKKQGVKLFPILYDRYSENTDFFRFSWNHKLKQGYANKLVEQVFGFSVITYYVDNWAEYFKSHNHSNSLRVEHPLVVKREINPRSLEGATRINAIYQGEINHQMRPPKAMLEVFEYIGAKDSEVTLHVFASGNGVTDVLQANQRNPERIRFYGKVSKDLADQYYDAADIQVILANKDKEIVSSKIFESVASGYPIVYFYFSEDEKSYRLLKKYPLVYFARQDKIDEQECERIREWMYDNKGKRIEFDFVRAAYADATPDLIVDSTLKAIG